MNPATQAVAWRARTSELRSMMCRKVENSVGLLTPGRATGEMSGTTRVETTHVATSRVTAIARLRAAQPPSTDQRPSCHASTVARVSRSPRASTYSLLLMGSHRQPLHRR